MFRPKRKFQLGWSDVAVGTVLSGGYGASAVYFLKNNLKEIMLHYWEFVLGYVVVMTLLGLLATRMIRGGADSKHFMVVVVKWLIRLLAVAAIFNATASPLGSLFSLVVLVVVYLAYELKKRWSKSADKKVKKKSS